MLNTDVAAVHDDELRNFLAHGTPPLPATARRAATVLGRPALRDEQLMEPATAIDLGALSSGGKMQQLRGPLAGVNLVRLP